MSEEMTSEAADWEEKTVDTPTDLLLLEVCKLRQRTTTKMKAIVWPPEEKQDGS